MSNIAQRFLNKLSKDDCDAIKNDPALSPEIMDAIAIADQYAETRQRVRDANHIHASVQNGIQE